MAHDAGQSNGNTVEGPPPGTLTLARGLDILRAVGQGATNLNEVAAAATIGKSAAHRMVTLLVQRGFLRSTHGTAFSLGPALIELGFNALYQSPVPVIAKPILEELARKYQDTVHLAVEDESQVLYVDKVPGTRGAQMRSRVGQRMPLSRTGIGKALLLDSADRWETTFDSESPIQQSSHQTKDAFLRRMATYAREGIALDLEDNEPGIRCVAAPIRDGSGKIIAAISMSATNPYMPEERMKALKAVMGSTAAQISRKLGYSGKTF
ncbi:transcriptional regulator [Arthrobacter sp. MYb229]|uniref:IclR family transcriptional regulator n=1 Tax=Micrococcaceae TaxID=1268 RepID=UPI000CFD9DF5|nr:MULTISPECIES: IclR family transcriptional regulator [unclassified Arthrobacter]PRA04365.1 transcriptional regulator [Arthrobacter sp. MYb229]PRB51721.1 transcriptional regulator [Arthrobacter sp. MYb216]